MAYRTKTYIAGDWTGDKEAIEKLYDWKKNKYLNLDFVDAHEYTQAKDTSLNCSIKKSLRERLNVSKKFILIVGEDTKTLRSGKCYYCKNYNISHCGSEYCKKGYSVDNRSYIDYECEMAIKDGLEIIVLYNYANVNKSKCPDTVRYSGKHINMYYYDKDGHCYWNYAKIKEAIND